VRSYHPALKKSKIQDSRSFFKKALLMKMKTADNRKIIAGRYTYR
jgi:hypothetical protein